MKNKTTRSTERNNRKKNCIIAKNESFSSFDKEEKSFVVRTTKSTKLGVKVSRKGLKKGMNVELIVPSTSLDGTDRSVRLELTGRQVMSIYNTLNDFLEKRYDWQAY